MPALLPRLLQRLHFSPWLGLLPWLCLASPTLAEPPPAASAPASDAGARSEPDPTPAITSAAALLAYLHDSQWSFCLEEHGPEHAIMTFYCQGNERNVRFYHSESDNQELPFSVVDLDTLHLDSKDLRLTFADDHRAFIIHDWPSAGSQRFGYLKGRLHPASCAGSPFANTHWQGEHWWIQFYADGAFHEKWGRVHYRGFWRPQQERQCIVFRGDGMVYHFTFQPGDQELLRNDQETIAAADPRHAFRLGEGLAVTATIEAINLPGDQVSLKTAGGKPLTLPAKSFTMADRLYLQEQGVTYGLDGPEAEEDFRKGLRDKFLHGEYAELEALAKHLRESEERFPGGDWKLCSFYKSFDARYDNNAEAWEASLAHMEAWLQASPHSPVAQLAAATILQRRATRVAGESRKALQKRAASLLEATASAAPDLPEWYSVQMEQSGVSNERWSAEARLALCVESASRFPRYIAPLATAAYFDAFSDNADPQPVWQLLKEAESHDDAHNEGAAARIFSRYCLYRDTSPGRFRLQREPIAAEVWPTLRESFRVLLNAYPETQWYRHQYAYTASVVGDREAAAEAFRDLPQGDEFPDIWQDGKVRDLMERWASGAGDPVWYRPKPALSCVTENRIVKLAFSPDSKRLAAGFSVEAGGQVGVWKVEPESIEAHASVEFEKLPLTAPGQPLQKPIVTGLQWSADGSSIAATIASEEDARNGVLRVWAQDGGAGPFTPTSTVGRSQPLRALAFDGNGDDVFVLATPADGDSEVLRVKLPSGSVTSVYHRDKLLTLQEGGGRLAVTGARYSFAWADGDAAPQPARLALPGTCGGKIRATVVTSDGRSFIAGGGNEENRWMPGWIHRFALDGATPPPLRQDIPMAGVTALAFDATRDWLVAGGWDGAITIWDLKTGALLSRFPAICDAYVEALAISPDGAWLAIGEANHRRLILYRLTDLDSAGGGKRE